MVVGSSAFVFSRSSVVGRALLLSVLAIGLIPSRAWAQGKDSHWGMSFSTTPSWTLMNTLDKLLFEENEDGSIDGSEFSIGFVRGSTLGGDWGVSFVNKKFKDGSGSTSISEECFTQTQCFTETETTSMQGVFVPAVEVHWFVPFATIKRRVQIGLNVAGGFGPMKGDVVTTTDSFEPTNFNPQTGKATLTPTHEVETNPAKDELLPYFPIMKLEAVGSFIVIPSLKIQVAGGVNFPSSSFRVGAVYLIGAH